MMERTPDNINQNKNSFILYLDQLEILNELSDEEAGILFKTIRNYLYTGDVPALEKILKLAFIPIKNSLHKDLLKWRSIRDKRAESGSLGGKQKVANVANASKSKQTVANGSKSKQSVANVAVIGNGIVNGIGIVSDIVNENIIQGKTKFSPPSLIDVTEYIKENNYHFSPGSFFNHYESNGWMVGKNKMKSWKATCDTWESRYKTDHPEQQKNEPPDWFKAQTENIRRRQKEEIDQQIVGDFIKPDIAEEINRLARSKSL